MKYIPVASLQNSYEVAGSYFNMSQGNRVRMYQTAHCGPPHTVPHFAQIQLPPGYTSFSSNAQYAPFYHPASCWKDLYEAIQVIKKLIEYYVECQKIFDSKQQLIAIHIYLLKGAQKLICINGWAVWDKLHLLRGEDLAIDNRTLGEILLDKAENQYVQVDCSIS